MSELTESVLDALRRQSLLKPEIGFLSRPVVTAIHCDLECKRETAERMFKTLVFEPDEETVTITEVLRPTKPGEPSVFFHSGAGTSFCVDHYEIDGVRL